MLKQNNRFDWTHTYYKGEKYEELGEKIFKYSVVDLVDCPYEPGTGTKCTKAVIDYFLYRYDNSDNYFTYNESLLKDYIDKVLPLKFGFSVGKIRLPYVDQQVEADDTLAQDYTSYKGLKDKFKFNILTDYIKTIRANISIRRTSNIVPSHQYIPRGKFMIATGTNRKKVGAMGILEDGLVYVMGLVGPEYKLYYLLPFRLVIM